MLAVKEDKPCGMAISVVKEALSWPALQLARQPLQSLQTTPLLSVVLLSLS
jgi:hypothetical protein